MKILEILDAYYPSVDGAISVVKNYAKEINKISDCTLAVPKASKKSGYVDNEEFEVIRCSSTSAPEGYRMGHPDVDSRFTKRIQEEPYDIIHAHSPFSMGRYAIKIAKKKKIPLVATLHTQYHRDFERVLGERNPLVKVMISYIMKLYKNADSVWTVSEASKNILRDYGYKGNIEVVRNGTDYVYPDNGNELIARVNAAHNLDGQKNVFIFVGRMAMYKGLKIIVDALDIVKKAGVDFKMLFVGGGFDIEELRDYVEEKGLTDNCILTGQIEDRELLQGYYLRGDMLLFPSTFDMASISKVEAAAHKTPAIVVRDSCSAEQISDGENGFLCEATGESFAEKIIYLSENPDVVKKAGENAYKTLYRTWEDTAKEIVEKYEEIIAGYKRHRTILQRAKEIRKARKNKIKKQNKG